MNKFSEVQICRLVYEDIYHSFMQYDTEMYGVLGSLDGFSITNWKFIHEHNSSEVSVFLKGDTLDDIVNNIWYGQKINFIGIVHSHIYGTPYLSQKDVNVALQLLRLNPQLPFVYMLIFHRACGDNLYGYKLSIDKIVKNPPIQFEESIWKFI